MQKTPLQLPLHPLPRYHAVITFSPRRRRRRPHPLPQNAHTQDPIYTRSLNSGDKVATMATQGTLNLLVVRGRETGWGFQTPQGQTAFITGQ